MATAPAFYVGKAAADQLRETGWFIGQFVPPEFGLRHQAGVELKWGMHADGETRTHPVAYPCATTISILLQGGMRLTFGTGDQQDIVTLRDPGDYVIFAPGTTHGWEAVGETIVLSVRFPSLASGPSGASPGA